MAPNQLILGPRPTTLAAYEQIVAGGLLPRSEMAVYRLLWKRGRMTRNEIDVALRSADQPNPNFSRRLAQMERRGVVARGPARACTVSGFTCETWSITESLPRKLAPAPAARPSAPALAAAAVEIGRAVPDPSANLRAVVLWMAAQDPATAPEIAKEPHERREEDAREDDQEAPDGEADPG